MNGRWFGTGFGLVLVCLLFVVNQNCSAHNLVPNHSFEERDDCWQFSGFYYPEDGPLGWFSGGESPDYFQACGSFGDAYSQPLNYVGFQHPQDGEDYVGIVTYAISPYETREFLMVQLNTQLTIGQTYYASFFANVAWDGTEPYPVAWMASNNVGALFTVESRQWEQGDPLPGMVNDAQVFHPWIIEDTVAWTLVSGSFVADSAYHYVMIGNHFDNTHTDTVAVGSSTNPPTAYLYIDNVCVTTDPDGCPMASEVVVQSAMAPLIYLNPATSQVSISGLPMNSRVVVHDAVGRMVLSVDDFSGVGMIDVSTWPRGAYVLRSFDGKDALTFKFVLAG